MSSLGFMISKGKDFTSGPKTWLQSFRALQKFHYSEKEITVKFNEWRHIRYVVLREDIENYGQRVESFQIAYKVGDEQFYTGFSIGNKQICKLRDFYLNQLVITVTAARDTVHLKDIEIFNCVVDH